jgi:cytochrome bd-type quinol oxidase subunit 2
MNKCILLISALFLFVSVVSQSNAKEYYQAKAKKQKTEAWMLLSAVAVTSFVGLSQINLAGSIDGEVNNTPGTTLFFTGLAATITSILFFSASKRNKKKSISVSYKNETALLMNERYFFLPNHSFPGLKNKFMKKVMTIMMLFVVSAISFSQSANQQQL